MIVIILLFINIGIAYGDGEDIFTEFQQNLLDTSVFITSSVSILGALIVIFSYFRIQQLQTFIGKQILNLSIANFTKNSSTDLCIFQATIDQFFTLSEVFWSGSISLTLFLTIIVRIKDVNRFYKLYFSICWGVPLILALILIPLGIYDTLAYGCWISQPLYRILFWYIFQFIVMIFSIIVFCLIIYRMRKFKESNSGNVLYYQVYLRVFNYILIFAIIFIVEAIYEIYYNITNNQDFIIYYIKIVFFTSQGFLNFLVFVVSRKSIFKLHLQENKQKSMRFNVNENYPLLS